MVLKSDESAFIVRAQLHSSALPTANTNLITDIAGPSTTTSGAVKFVIYMAVSIATGVINLKRTRGGTTVTEQLTTGNTAANLGYTFEIFVDQGETINIQYSATTGTVNKLFVIEKQL
jgi:hypothetical protein